MFRTRAPLSKIRRSSTARLACVRPPASVHPEPGSNSPLYVCLTHSKLLTLYFFLTFLVVICMSMISLLFALLRSSFLSLIPNCECKSINYFLIDQIFLKEFLTFFHKPNNFLNLKSTKPSTSLPNFSRFGSAKIRSFFNYTNFLSKIKIYFSNYYYS